MAAKEKDTSLGTKEVASKLKVEPSFLRRVLRSSGKSRDEDKGRYEFTDKDIPRLAKTIEDYKKEQSKRAEKAKDDTKKASKKASKKKKVEEDDAIEEVA
jgi:hypothetical protein